MVLHHIVVMTPLKDGCRSIGTLLMKLLVVYGQVVVQLKVTIIIVLTIRIALCSNSVGLVIITQNTLELDAKTC